MVTLRSGELKGLYLSTGIIEGFAEGLHITDGCPDLDEAVGATCVLAVTPTSPETEEITSVRGGYQSLDLVGTSQKFRAKFISGVHK